MCWQCPGVTLVPAWCSVVLGRVYDRAVFVEALRYVSCVLPCWHCRVRSNVPPAHLLGLLEGTNCICTYVHIYVSVCPSIYLCIYLSLSAYVCLSTSATVYVSLSIHLFVHLPLCVCIHVYMPAYLCVYQPVHISNYLFIYLAFHRSVSISIYVCLPVYVIASPSVFVSLSIHLSVHLPLCVYPCVYVCLSMHLSICLYIRLSIYLSVYLSIHIYIPTGPSLNTWNLRGHKFNVSHRRHVCKCRLANNISYWCVCLQTTEITFRSAVIHSWMDGW